MKHIVTLTIPLLTPGRNILMRRHWTYEHRLKTQWFYLMRQALACHQRVQDAQKGELRRVTFTRHAIQVLDQDNFVGGAKTVLDNLRRPRVVQNRDPKKLPRAWAGLSLIWDDDGAHLEAIYLQERVKTRADQRTTITVETFEPD